MKIYNIYHEYDVDGGFGDAIPESILIATFENADDANAFVNKYSAPEVYDRPYSALWHHKLVVSETEIITHSEFDINKSPKDYQPYGW